MDDGGGSTRPAATGAGLRRVRVAQFAGAAVDGVVLSTFAVHAGAGLGMDPVHVGLVLAAGSVAALVLAVPIGGLADALGLRRTALALTALSAVALLLYAVARGPALLTAAAIAFAVAQLGLGAIRQAIVAVGVAPERRTAARGVMHAVLNGGIGLGAAVAAGSALLYLGLPRDGRSVAANAWNPVALRDARFLRVAGLAAVVQLTMPVLSVLLPLWIATRTGAPAWTAAAVLALNTALVLVLQPGIAARVSDRAVRPAAVGAAAALVVATASFGLAAGPAPSAAIALVVLGAVALTLGEMLGGAVSWHLAFRGVPDAQQGRYQSTFAISSSVARIVGAGAVLPLVLAWGLAGWLLVGAAMAVACLLLAAEAHGPGGRRGGGADRVTHPRPHARPRTKEPRAGEDGAARPRRPAAIGGRTARAARGPVRPAS